MSDDALKVAALPSFLLFAFALLLLAPCVHAQTVVYSEDFSTGATNWTFNVNTGSNALLPNVWIVSAAEGGVAPPGCGVSDNGNPTLHVECTTKFCGSLITGATYNAGQVSNKRAESPSINTVGFSNLALSFNAISVGDGLNDNASVWFNDGTGWQTLIASVKSTQCLNGRGQWTSFTAPLPSTAANISNLQIGFNWTNNNDFVGFDPSIAIDDVQIITLGPGIFADSFDGSGP